MKAKSLTIYIIGVYMLSCRSSSTHSIVNDDTPQYYINCFNILLVVVYSILVALDPESNCQITIAHILYIAPKLGMQLATLSLVALLL